MTILALDIGGTGIKYAQFDESAKPVTEVMTIDTDVNRESGENHVLDQVLDLIEAQGEAIDGVAIATAGVVDAENGRIAYAGVTMPNYTGTDFRTAIGERFGLPVSVENDVSAMGIAEARIGAAKGVDSVVCLTIGTGIGGVVIDEGRVWHGIHNTAGEAGYLTVDGEDWQDIASTTALVKLYQERSGKSSLNGKDVFAAYDNGDEDAIVAIDTLTERIAKGLLDISYLLNPTRIVLGGGIMARADVLLPKIKAQMAERVEQEMFLPGDVVTADLSQAANLYGAVYHYLDEHGTTEA